jgi:MFS superfamily sulfate permease-like transporter
MPSARTPACLRINDAAVAVIDEPSKGLRVQTFGTCLVGITTTTVVAGVAAGIALSLVFLIGLNSLSLG